VTYHWFGPTSLYDLAFPEAVGSYWYGAIDVQIELVNIDSDGPDNQSWLQIMDEYGNAEDPRDSFSQAGFLAAKIFTDTMLGLDADSLDRDTVSEALRGVTNYESDLLCGPWYFGPGETHNASHAGRMVQLNEEGTWTVTQDCTEIEDPALVPILELESELGIGE
jgi:branched-chain amino acid transport system substrate-binding protein